MASTSDPTLLSNATRLRPRSFLGHSRSPSRSPLLRTQFAAHEIDPLLSNLSPDSTLHALQATETIPGSQKVPEALSKSIADASTFERELGIRAAFAAQKIREWLQELTAWSWPDSRASAIGMGFSAQVPDQASANDPFVGSLRRSQIRQYETRLSDIQGALDALEIEEVKDYVLSAHVPTQSRQKSRLGMGIDHRMSYGRMRDFTALITATVIRALPDLAKLNMLLTLWKARLTVLQLIPAFLSMLESTRRAVRAAMASIRDDDSAVQLNGSAFESTKSTLAEQVASIGAQVDRMLDVLEGHVDRLPQGWIDTLENIELDFASWAVEAQRRVQQNEWMMNSTNKSLELPHLAQLQEQNSKGVGLEKSNDLNMDHAVAPQGMVVLLGEGSTAGEKPLPEPSTVPTQVLFDESPAKSSGLDERSIDLIPVSTPSDVQHGAEDDRDSTPLATKANEKFQFPMSGPTPGRTSSQRKPPLTLELPKSGHKREVSEVSIADSAYSAFSGISEAEIFDATATEVVASPKVNVVDNPFRASRDDLSSFGTSARPRSQDLRTTAYQVDPEHGGQVSGDRYASRPPLVQRASTTSMELIGKSQIRRVTLSRSASQDLTSLVAQRSDGTPQNALERLNGDPSSKRSPLGGLDPTTIPGSSEVMLPTLQQNASHDLASPLSYHSRAVEPSSPDSPSLPRRSSKRSKQDLKDPVTPNSGGTNEESTSRSSPDLERKKIHRSNDENNGTSPGKVHSAETLQSKIQDILTSLPTAIRLASNSDSSESPSQLSTASSSRSSTPAPALVLSPAKKDKSSRRSSGIDSEVKVYHLTRPGQPRDAQPTKLFVRLVGEHGERVMVRVGGGWADLGEYLREYSLHHGRRSTVDGRLEVANFPANASSPKEALSGNSPTPSGNFSKAPTGIIASRTKSRSPSASDTSFDFASLRDIDAQKPWRVTPTTGRARSPEPTTWTPPPVPPIPNSYTMHSPTTISTISTRGNSTRTSALILPSDPLSSSMHSRTTIGDPNTNSSLTSTTTSPSVSTTTTVHSPTISSQNYTPLGAAGPKSSNKHNSRRVATFSAQPTSENEAWVEGLVGQARAVSGSALSPITTTTTSGSLMTTTTTTVSTPTSRRVSAAMNSSPASGRTTPAGLATTTPSSRRISAIRADSPVSGRASPSPSPSPSVDKNSPSGSSRSKSRMSLGDVSGIKRVFLRKKSEK